MLGTFVILSFPPRRMAISAFALSLALASSLAPKAVAQSDLIDPNRQLQLAEDSPFRDPDIIYLEADELINHGDTKVLTAQGEVEGRYQDRTLRADKVIYNLDNGRVFAVGNVVLIDATGTVQYSDKLELSSQLEAGTASNFTARIPGGGITGAALAVRGNDEKIELFNAYYTACEPCEDEKTGKFKKPTWRLRARRVRQDQQRKAVVYNDAIFELFGVPVFYMPYLAHPDPTVGRASGWLAPFGGSTGSRGAEIITPYYWAISDYSELTLTPHIYTKVNPLVELDYRRKFHAGEINISGSATYSSVFDNDGNGFNDSSQFINTADDIIGDDFQGHLFADGRLQLARDWDIGLGIQAVTNDFHLDNYGLNDFPTDNGLYDANNRRLISQAFLVGQGDNFRISAAGYEFTNLRSRIFEQANGQFEFVDDNDAILPTVLPSIQAQYSITDPIIGGRAKAYGDIAALRRDEGADYTRSSVGVEYSKTVIAPGGLELKPFANARYDDIDLAYTEADGTEIDGNDFSRELGQIGVDIRYPLIRHGDNVDIIIEPRALVTQSYGDAKLDQFNQLTSSGTQTLFQDSIDIDLDHNLLFEPNKATGYDFWQEGTRTDVGVNVIADWKDARAKAFIGKSFTDEVVAPNDFPISSGLTGDNSDIIGMFEVEVDGGFRGQTRLRYDDDENKLRRIDTSLSYTGDRFSVAGNYYKIDEDTRALLSDPTAPTEQISAVGKVKLTDSWSLKAGATHDLASDTTRRQSYGLAYQDDCTKIEFLYNVTEFENDATRNNNSFGVRLSLLSLSDLD